eukprot:1481123-Rhodomonas_salina.1
MFATFGAEAATYCVISCSSLPFCRGFCAFGVTVTQSMSLVCSNHVVYECYVADAKLPQLILAPPGPTTSPSTDPGHRDCQQLSRDGCVCARLVTETKRRNRLRGVRTTLPTITNQDCSGSGPP